MKGQEMKNAVRYKNKVFPLKKQANRGNQFVIERLQVALRCPQEGFFESADILIPHAELGDLKAQQLQQVSNARKHSDGEDSHSLARNDSGHKLLASNEVLDQGRTFWNGRLEFFQGKVRGSFEGCVFPLVGWKLA